MSDKKRHGVIVVGDSNSVNANRNTINVKNTGVVIQGSGNIGYKALISTASPGLILFLLDQSGSMAENGKANLAATAVNRAIYEIIIASRSGEQIKNRAYVGVIGYGKSVNTIVGGMVSEIANRPIRIEPVVARVPDGVGGLTSVNMEMPVWVEPYAEYSTPMAEAFDKAFETIVSWVKNNSSSFPPIVINITDGVPNDFNLNQGTAPFTEASALKLMSLKTDDGNLLLFNTLISGDSTVDSEISFPTNISELPDLYSKFLFRISSEVPARLLEEAWKAGLSPKARAKGMVYNSRKETFIKLLTFGSSVAR